MGLHGTVTSSKLKPLAIKIFKESSGFLKFKSQDRIENDYSREGQKLLLQLSNVSVYNNMAPALTEPLNQTNKLSSSTSASPHPTSNNYLINNNHSIENNNTTSDSNVGDNTVILSSIESPINCRRITKEIKHKGPFQLAFERVVANQAAARQKQTEGEEELLDNSSLNGKDCNHQMGSMCDANSSTVITKSLKFDNLDHQPNYQQEEESEELKVNRGSEEIKQEQESKNVEEQVDIEQEEQQHMDLTNCETTNDSSQNESQLNVTCAEGDTSDTNDVTTITIVSDNDTCNAATSSVDEKTEAVEDKPSYEKRNQYQQQQEQQQQHQREQEPEQDQEQQNIEEDIIPIRSYDVPQTTMQEDQVSPNFGDDTPTKSDAIQKSPTETPTSLSSSPLSQQRSHTPVLSLAPQSIISGMSILKDFIKESNEMDQVLGDMDLLQVLKGLDTNPNSEALCDLAGNLVFFNDVDVMNYEEMGTPAKDTETREIRIEIEKKQKQMQRKCDFLLRRLRKIQSRYMGKHTSEEIAGLFEWAHRVVRRNDLESYRPISYEEDKRRAVSTASMRTFLRRIDSVATAQHLNPVKCGKIAHTSINLNTSGSSKTVVMPVIPRLDEKISEEIGHISGMLQTELKQIQNSLDSDATASSSGGESADEMVTYNNHTQLYLSIAKREAWRYAHIRARIAARWMWLLAQISDLEYRIKQHQDLLQQIKKCKGAVIAEKNPFSMQTNSPNNNVTGTDTNATLPASVNGYTGVLPGNSKPMDTDSTPPNGAYDAMTTDSLGCSRTKPFQRTGFRKRRLFQTANAHTISKKVARPSTLKCGCQWPLQPCALCTGRSDPTAPRDLPDTMTPSQRVALLDPGFHPVLSFSKDISNSIHIEATAYLPEWQNRVLRYSSRTMLKGTEAAQKAVEREGRSKKFVDSRRKHNRKYSTAQDIMAANKLKIVKNRRAALHGSQYNNHLIKSNKQQQHQHHQNQRKLMSSLNAGGIIIKKSRDVVSNNMDGSTNMTNNIGLITGNAITTLNNVTGHGGLSSNGLSDIMDNTTSGLCGNLRFENSNGLLPRSKNSSPTPGSHGSSSYKNERIDRRNRNSYDIDNIVIPYSVAAATRVEILPYKEIPTPKWRIISEESENDGNVKQTTKISGIFYIKPESSNNENVKTLTLSNDEDEVEDISDEAIQIRHERALLEEQKKFQTYLKFPWSTRSRANRRVDSRTESSGANTPDSTSPAANTSSVAGDQESIPSPAAPSTPQTPLDHMDGVEGNATNPQNSGAISSNPAAKTILNFTCRRNERKRTVSSKKEYRDEYRRSSTPDTKETIPPFEPLKFPLSDEFYEAMLQMMPNDHQLKEDCLKVNTCDGSNNRLRGSNDKISRTTATSGTPLSSTATTMAVHYTNALKDGRYTGRYNLNSSNASYCGDSDTLAYELTTFETGDSLIGEDSDTDSAESGLQDEDPNDPEWREPA